MECGLVLVLVLTADYGLCLCHSGSMGVALSLSLSLSLTAPRTLSRIVTTIQNTAIQQYNTTVHFPGNVVSLKRNRQN